MIGEIDRDYYCSAGNICSDGLEYGTQKVCFNFRGNNDRCPSCHRKYPTPEQFKEEYGEEYPEDWAVYVIKDTDLPKWEVTTLKKGLEMVRFPTLDIGDIVCAVTPWGNPPHDWGPE